MRPLKAYQEKRNLKKSKEPLAKLHKKKSSSLSFVIHEHAARRHHYDLRLEVDGVLKSWAVPKEPSLDPKVKRLAIQVEDHPYSYKDFEGVIERGYGAGRVDIWDHGIYNVENLPARESEAKMREGLKNGELHFHLDGKKLRGEYALIRIKNQGDKSQWLLIKKKAPLPKHLSPMLATLTDAPFDSDEWLFEIKWDGYRALCHINEKGVELYSRRNLSYNKRYSEIVEWLKKIKKEVILDGEIVALDDKGRPNFQALQNNEKGSIFYYVFDLLYLDGKDLREVPLIERKALLKKLLPRNPKSRVQFVDHIEDNGEAFFSACKKNQLEGVIAKEKKSLYLDGVRSQKWLKIKTHPKQEALICGFTSPKRSRKQFGALILGVYKEKRLHYAGKVGTGFDEKTLQELGEKLQKLTRSTSPFSYEIPDEKTVTWVKPELVCEVTFREWTSEEVMRQPVYLGLREDKQKKEIVLERPKNQILQFSNLDKVFWQEEKITKGDLLKYYESVAPFILPYLKGRPLSLKRFPNGIGKPGFFQKNITDAPSWMKTASIPHKEKTIHYLIVEDLDSLLYTANLACIEFHPFLSTYDSLENPDFLVLDLDPIEIPFSAVVEVAQAIHELLESLQIPSQCKTSGGDGLHVFIPLGALYTYEQGRQFGEILAHLVHRQLPSITSLERNPNRRRGKVYIDYLQNALGQTVVAPYSVRAYPGAPVSTPLEWKEVKKGLDPKKFTLKTVPKRLKGKKDLFAHLLKEKIDMKKILKKLEKIR